MLLINMNIFRLMIHAQQVEGDNPRKQAKENNKAIGLGTMSILNINRVVEISRKINREFSPFPFIC